VCAYLTKNVIKKTKYNANSHGARNMNSSTTKLTKKQKKALAFRERHGKGKGKTVNEENDVPVMEDQDLAEAEVEDSRMAGEERDQKAEQRVAKVVEGKKRKREEDVLETKDDKRPTTTKKQKVETHNSEKANGAGEGDEVEPKPKGKGSKQQRFILFVGAVYAFALAIGRSYYVAGNLKYTTTKEAIQEHFAKTCGMSMHSHTIRLQSPKPWYEQILRQRSGLLPPERNLARQSQSQKDARSSSSQPNLRYSKPLNYITPR
jgi:nucleolar protein 6